MSKGPKKLAPAPDVPAGDEAAEPMRLTPEEAQKLQHFRLTKQLRDKEAECLRLKVHGIHQARKMLELSSKGLDLDEKLLTDEQRHVEQVAHKDRLENERYLEVVRTRLGIAGAFGYHPDTLEIVES